MENANQHKAEAPQPPAHNREPGALRGQIEMSADFDAIPEGFEEYVEVDTASAGSDE